MTGSSREADWERAVRRAVERLRFGSVEVQVHDGRVVQVETREKVRFADERRPDDRRRESDDVRTDRKAGGAEPTHRETSK
jgi:hypothetical protein